MRERLTPSHTNSLGKHPFRFAKNIALARPPDDQRETGDGKAFFSVGIERLSGSADGSVACPCRWHALVLVMDARRRKVLGWAFRERMLSNYEIALLNMR